MNRKTVQKKRDAYRTAEDELTKASHLHSALHEFSEKRSRGTIGDVEEVTDAFETFLRPGPGETISDRRNDLSYLTEKHVPTDSGGQITFFSAAGQYAGNKSAAGTTLQSLVNDLQGFVTAGSKGGSKDPSAAVATFDALAASGSGPMAKHLATVTGFVVTAAEGKRDALVDDLNNDYSSGSQGQTIKKKGTIQKYIESVDDEVAELSDDQPLALLPVRLETRFIGPERDEVSDGHELWMRIYPDHIHNDAHEEQLTDVEVRWGRNFWASLWVASHETLTDDKIDRQYLQKHLPSEIEDGTIETLLELDPASFPDNAVDRKDAIKERVWNQLLERFGRERAAYVVHELKPKRWMQLVAPMSVYKNDAVAKKTLTKSGGKRVLSFPAVDRKPESWTRPPIARLLPDRWIVFGIWEHEGQDIRETFVLRSNPVHEPLPVGPTPEAMAIAEQYGSGAPGAGNGSGSGSGGSSGAVDTDADIAWITDFAEAMKAGMAVRIEDQDIFEAGTPSGIDDLADGTFRKLIVTGVTASMSADETAKELKRLFDTHHYTEGLELIEQGTPTNNFDKKSGYSSKDDPRESMAIECSFPTIEHGENTDGDMLARALGIDPVTTGSDEHVFAHVENADADYQTRAWHMNSALWSGTLGYYMQTMLSSFTPPESIRDILKDGSFNQLDMHSWTEIVRGDRVGPTAGSYEATRRHFINYVRAQGPLPAFRAGTQPYGVLPAMPTSDHRKSPTEKLAVFYPETVGRTAQIAGGQGSGSGDEGSGSDDGSGLSIDPSVWEREDEIGTEDGIEKSWESMPHEQFRNTYAARAAHGSISDEQLAKTYPPEEAATVFTKQELATHYDPEAAATVLSQDELRTYYSEAELSDITGAGNRTGGGET